MKHIVVTAGFEWAKYSWLEAINNNDIHFILNIFPPLIKRIWWKLPIHNKFFVKMLIPYVKKQLGLKKVPTKLIIYDRTPLTSSPELIQALKKENKDLKVYYLYSDIVKLSGSVQLDILNSLKETYDDVFTFDPKDAIKHQFKYFGLVYSPSITMKKDVPIIYDLFYVGQAKDRYETLLEIYNKAKNENLKCKFFITGVPIEKQINSEDIIYNTTISYEEVLNYISQSRCIVDAIQRNSTGLTIKTCESVVFDRKLITTNEQVSKENFYNKSNIMLYHNNNSISEFLSLEFKPYSMEDKYQFSYKHFFESLL